MQERTAEELAEDETIDCNIVEFLKEKVGHSSVQSALFFWSWLTARALESFILRNWKKSMIARPSVSKLDRRQTGSQKERQLADGMGGGRGAESYDRKKAWSSMNYSILSGFMSNLSQYCLIWPDGLFPFKSRNTTCPKPLSHSVV